MSDLIKYADFVDYEKAFDEEVKKEGEAYKKLSEAFVRIGYLIRIGQDTDIIARSGYKDVWEFAEKKYGIDKTYASRYININERFSEGGYSDTIQEKYKGFGFAKLSVMLTLPDGINVELSPNFSKSEILAIKEEYDEEKKISDVEVLLEGETPEQSVIDNNLHKALYQLCKDEPELYVKLYEALPKGKTAVRDIIVPNGEKIYSIRIQGIGRVLLSIKGIEQSITLTNMRSSEKEVFQWGDMMNYLSGLMISDLKPEASWSQTYGEEFPKKAEVAPVQPPQKKEAPRKESKVQKVKEKPKAPIKEPEKEPEEQLPGQDSILNHPEYLPEEMKETIEPQTGSSPSEEPQPENITENSEIVDTTPLEEKQAQAVQEMENTLEEEKATVVVETPERKSQEELVSIWNNAAIAAAKLNIFFQNSGAMELVKDEIPTKTLNRAYKNAISVAADLERILNHGKI